MIEPGEEIEADDDDEAITVAEACRRLGCSRRTLAALTAAKTITGHRVGEGKNPRGIRISLASIRAYKRRFALGGPAPGQPTGAAAPPKARPSRGHKRAMQALRDRGIVR